LLIVSIIFANKLWIIDVSSMSLYWVARLPIERPPKEQASRNPLETSPGRRAAKPVRRSRQWKIALSLAIVGALAAPFVFQTYRANPRYEEFVPLSAEQRERMEAYLASHCRTRETDECFSARGWLLQGGIIHVNATAQDLAYLAINAGASLATFVSIAFLIPILIRGVAFLARRYWRWLNA
jgi:hypothetical protein